MKPKKKIRHKTGYGSEWEEEKPSKVQKVLHVSITALAFLAFAGYLLCMIVQAIKSKGDEKSQSGIHLVPLTLFLFIFFGLTYFRVYSKQEQPISIIQICH